MDVIPRSTGDAEGLIEQLMNQEYCGSSFVDAGIPFLYRIQGSGPEPQ